MFLALRDLRFATGRFSLIVTVVALMTLLVGFLTGLTGGLAMQNISALMGMRADRIVFSVPDGDDPTFEGSAITASQAEEWAGAADATLPLGVASALLEPGTGESEASESVVLLGTPAGSVENAPAHSGGLVLGESTATELGVTEGEEVSLAGATLTLERIVPDTQYAHRPAAYLTLEDWHDYRANTRQPEQYATVLLVDGVHAAGESGQFGESEAVDAAASLDASAGTSSESFLPGLLALGSFRSEIGSLAMMIGMLVLISTLVIGVFFLVWSMQRQRDIAVLKAIGARTLWLATDALGQALVVLLIGAGIGIALTAGLGVLAAQAMPFVMNAATLLLPPLGMTLAGMLGALVSLRHITTVDPNTALQASAA